MYGTHTKMEIMQYITAFGARSELGVKQPPPILCQALAVRVEVRRSNCVLFHPFLIIIPPPPLGKKQEGNKLCQHEGWHHLIPGIIQLPM